MCKDVAAPSHVVIAALICLFCEKLNDLDVHRAGVYEEEAKTQEAREGNSSMQKGRKI